MVHLFEVLGWVLGIAGAVTAITGAIFAVVKLWPLLVVAVQVADAMRHLPALNVQVAEIHHEVHYNNGSSVKDAVRRVETGVTALTGDVAALSTRLDERAAEDDKIWAALDALAKEEET